MYCSYVSASFCQGDGSLKNTEQSTKAATQNTLEHIACSQEEENQEK
jgi:hypothetical protein